MKHIVPSLVILFTLLMSCQRIVREDHSFTLEEYYSRGIPEVDLTWGIEQYETIFGQLSNIKYQQPASLPRKNSKKSGELFDRLISRENLAFLENDSMSLAEKVYMIRNFELFMDNLIDIYEDIFRTEQYYHLELAHIYVSKVALGQEMLNLAKIIVSSEDKEDRAQVTDLRSVQYMYLDKLYQVMEKQKFRSLYSKQEYRMLCDSVGASLSRNMEWFDPEISGKIAQQLQLVTDSVDIPAVRREYQDILNSLEQ